MKTSSSRASKRTPTWHKCMVAPKSLSGQPYPDLIQRLARKGFWSYHTAISRGGSFRSSGWARFHGTLRILGHFFYNPNKAIWTLCFTLKSQQIIKEFQGGRKCTIRSDLHASGSRPAPQDANEDLRLSNALYHLLWESQITIFPKKKPGPGVHINTYILNKGNEYKIIVEHSTLFYLF